MRNYLDSFSNGFFFFCKYLYSSYSKTQIKVLKSLMYSIPVSKKLINYSKKRHILIF